MRKGIIIFAVLLCFCVGGTSRSRTTPSSTGNSRVESPNNYHSESANILDSALADTLATVDYQRYHKYISVPATEQMPALSFELIGVIVADDYYTNFYYPLKLIAKTDETIIQEISFSKDDFAPCTLDTFDFEYGDFKFDGYGGFKILSTSMGRSPSYYFWIWDKNKNSFVKYPDLELVGYMAFDYDKQLINVSNSVSATYHEFTTYKYIDDKLTLIEKVIDADYDGNRKVYRLINSELELIETTKSYLKG